jgi:hypothetical protein
MQQGLQGETRAQRQGDFKDNSDIETKIWEIVLFYASPVHLSIYEGKYFVLFCSCKIHQTGMLQMVFLLSLESSQPREAYGLGSMTFRLAVQKFLNIE